MLLPKIIHSLRIRSMTGRTNYAFLWILHLPYSLHPLVEMQELWCWGLKFSYYIPNLDKKFDIKIATIIFLFSFFESHSQAARMFAKFSAWRKIVWLSINTLMDPAGTVSCNLICKEIIWVIDGTSVLSDKRVEVWFREDFQELYTTENKRWSQASGVKLHPLN